MALAEVVALHNRLLEKKVARQAYSHPRVAARENFGAGPGWMGRTKHRLAGLVTAYAVLIIMLVTLNFFLIGLLQNKPGETSLADLSLGHLQPAVAGTLTTALNEVLPWQE